MTQGRLKVTSRRGLQHILEPAGSPGAQPQVLRSSGLALCVDTIALSFPEKQKAHLPGWVRSTSLQTCMSWALCGLHREPHEQVYNLPFELEVSVSDSENEGREGICC